MSEPVKLHLGCGPERMDGWVNIDSVAEFKPDLVHDLNDPLPYEDQTVDEIKGIGLLEHFDKYVRFVVFHEWARVLKVGGKITLGVPDFGEILRKYKKFGFDNFVDFIFGENMFRSEVYIGHYGNHKSAYSVESLTKFVALFGIEPLDVKSDALNITFVGEKKRHVPTKEIDEHEIYSHANKHGIGKESLPLKFVREKIKVFQENEKSLSVK